MAQATLQSGAGVTPVSFGDLLDALHRTGEKHAFPEHGAGIIVIWQIRSRFNRLQNTVGIDVTVIDDLLDVRKLIAVGELEKLH